MKLRKLFLRAGERAEVNNMANAKDKRSKKKSRRRRDENRESWGRYVCDKYLSGLYIRTGNSAGFAHDAYCFGLGSEDGKLPEWSQS